jgi:hypothetical protein
LMAIQWMVPHLRGWRQLPGLALPVTRSASGASVPASVSQLLPIGPLQALAPVGSMSSSWSC